MTWTVEQHHDWPWGELPQATVGVAVARYDEHVLEVWQRPAFDGAADPCVLQLLAGLEANDPGVWVWFDEVTAWVTFDAEQVPERDLARYLA